MNHSTRIIARTALSLLVVGILTVTAASSQAASSSIEQTFQKAKQNYLDKNMNAASKQIKKAANYMKVQAAKASDKGKDALEASAEELDKLSDDVKKGVVTSPKRIEDAFARAYLALASNDHVKATQSWAQKKSDQAGEALESANANLEKSFTWAGQKIEKGTSDAMNKSKNLATKLKKKGNLIADEVGKGLQGAGKEIEKLGKKLSF